MATQTPVTEVTQVEELKQLAEKHTLAVCFYADWYEPSTELKKVFEQLASSYKGLKFVTVDTDKETDELQELFKVDTIPAFVFLKGSQTLANYIGADASVLIRTLDSVGNSKADSTDQPPLEERLKQLIQQDNVMLFMKGVPTDPKCGFSRTMVGILNENGIKYGHFNILADNEVREGLKKFSKWPTYPQLYAKGKLVGGLDIVKELVQDDELKDALA